MSVKMSTAAAKEFDHDQPVVEAVMQGDRFAFEELCRRHQDWVRAVIFGVLCDRERVDDVSQQVWTTAWEKFGAIRDARRWRPWLYRLARNAAVDAGRDRTRRKRNDAQFQRHSAASDNGHDASPVRAERHALVMRAVGGLPALYREPFVLRHVEGWSYRQIAEVMDIPVDTVETRLVRARRLLRDALEDKV